MLGNEIVKCSSVPQTLKNPGSALHQWFSTLDTSHRVRDPPINSYFLLTGKMFQIICKNLLGKTQDRRSVGNQMSTFFWFLIVCWYYEKYTLF